MARKWLPAEDQRLTSLVEVYGKQWGLIASHMGNRSTSQISARWEKCLDPKLTKGPFTEDEDRIITEYVEQNGPHNWPGLSEILVNRSPKQCRERWMNHLNPSLVSTPWSREEDFLIFDNVQRIGAKWSLLSKLLDGRTDNAIKNRWNSSISKRIQLDESGRRILVPDLPRRGRGPPKPAGDRPPPIRTDPPKPRVLPPVDPLQTLQALPMEASCEEPAEATNPSPGSPFGLFRSPTTPLELFNTGQSGASTPWSNWEKWTRPAC
jgi:hypothetical protein